MAVFVLSAFEIVYQQSLSRRTVNRPEWWFAWIVFGAPAVMLLCMSVSRFLVARSLGDRQPVRVEPGLSVSAPAQHCQASASDPSGFVAAPPGICTRGRAFRGGAGRRHEGRHGDDDGRSAEINQPSEPVFRQKRHQHTAAGDRSRGYHTSQRDPQ
eukprot:g15222.t2